MLPRNRDQYTDIHNLRLVSTCNRKTDKPVRKFVNVFLQIIKSPRNGSCMSTTA